MIAHRLTRENADTAERLMKLRAVRSIRQAPVLNAPSAATSRFSVDMTRRSRVVALTGKARSSAYERALLPLCGDVPSGHKTGYARHEDVP